MITKEYPAVTVKREIIPNIKEKFDKIVERKRQPVASCNDGFTKNNVRINEKSRVNDKLFESICQIVKIRTINNDDISRRFRIDRFNYTDKINFCECNLKELRGEFSNFEMLK